MPSTKKMLMPLPFKEHIPLNTYSTFQIGGPARYLIEAREEAQFEQSIAFAKEKNLPFLVIGKGSNILFDDRGFAGVVIVNKLASLVIEGNLFIADAGYSFAQLGSLSARRGFAGLEFASGIPGSVGGAVYMNAGAGGEETKDALHEVLFLKEDGTKMQIAKNDIEFRYRFSSFQAIKGIILKASFLLKKDEAAKQRQMDLLQYRLNTQPYKSKSAGCCFKNPTEMSAGALIEQLGLKGYRVGGAEISSHHANFIVNAKEAKAQDVLHLLHYVQEQVKKRFGIELEKEVRYIPYDFQG